MSRSRLLLPMELLVRARTARQPGPRPGLPESNWPLDQLLILTIAKGFAAGNVSATWRLDKPGLATTLAGCEPTGISPTARPAGFAEGGGCKPADGAEWCRD